MKKSWIILIVVIIIVTLIFLLGYITFNKTTNTSDKTAGISNAHFPNNKYQFYYGFSGGSATSGSTNIKINGYAIGNKIVSADASIINQDRENKLTTQNLTCNNDECDNLTYQYFSGGEYMYDLNKSFYLLKSDIINNANSSEDLSLQGRLCYRYDSLSGNGGIICINKDDEITNLFLNSASGPYFDLYFNVYPYTNTTEINNYYYQNRINNK
jgi:hypothetical protein